ncbi:enoyl-CoA hydratase [Candidimonas sp. SYP-B2681]|uniref:enoyl-CoA hydratase/isomerase family protein n=1 Tax=Candidimonas sp. SYP-B2681 TaxID=2497686 RepID=UPI000F88E39E|nr:enoyl-CoA hydratase-related protein [Candidimonas sp. SYP-B2681]RTZ45488.1 enoyl-CoA hydratase [Candidimonas sp. SYP-B2681]
MTVRAYQDIKKGTQVADLELSKQGRVIVARLNRPEKKNAQSEEMLETLVDALRSANEDPEVSCFVLTGAGDAFCSGGDLGRRSNELAAVPTPLDRMDRLHAITHRVARAVEEFEKPLIAAVNGAAVGAGMDLSLMCDIRFAAKSARFAESYIRVGLIPGNGGCYFLPRIVGIAKALELLWTGEFLSADEALELGIVTRVYDDEQLMTETLAFAERLAEGPPIQQREIKKLLYQSLNTDLRTSLRAVSAHMAVVQSTDDYKEAISAFKERRKPIFKGR